MGVFLFLGIGCVNAQDSNAGTGAAVAPSSKVPDTYDTDPAADPARPTVTNPAHIPPPGYLQFEQGAMEALATPGGPDRQFNIGQTTKIALEHHLMIFASSEPFARTTQTGVVSNDAGAVALGAQVVLFDEGEGHSKIPTLALSYQAPVYDGTAADLDIGSANKTFLVLASGNLFGLHYDTNFIVNEQQGDSPNVAGHKAPRRAQFAQTLSVTQNLTSKFSISEEIYRFTQPLTGGNAIGNLYALGYTVRKTVVLDCGFSKGLTSTSTDWQTFAGFTYLLPKRLWKAKS